MSATQMLLVKTLTYHDASTFFINLSNLPSTSFLSLLNRTLVTYKLSQLSKNFIKPIYFDKKFV